MFAKYKINLTTLSSATTATTINIPISLDYDFIGKSELIEEVFVKTEVEKAINPITDYEKGRFTPIDLNDVHLDKITYSLDIDGTNYGAIGFTNDDIRFEKESFKNTFLNLAFYDSPNSLTQNLISFFTLFSTIGSNDINPNGTIKPSNQIKLNFNVENPILNPRGNAEGFYLYNDKNVFNETSSIDLYMRASFKNAKTGRAENLMVVDTAQDIDKLVNELYTKFTLTKTPTGFYYKIDNKYKGNQPNNVNNLNNVTYQSNNLTVKLYKIKAT